MARKRSAAARKRAAMRPPQLVNISKLRKRIPANALVHLSDDQWEQLRKGIGSSRAARPRSGVMYTPLPDGGGLMSGVCNPGPGQECAAIPRMNPDGTMTWRCRCETVSVPGAGRPVRPRPPACELVTQIRPRLRILCENNSCDQNCRLRLWRVGIRFQIACVCTR